jgi:effector-binding domain-containing protein
VKELGVSIQEALRPIYEIEGIAGTPYARYLEWREEDCDFQAGVLLPQRVAAVQDVCVDQYPAYTAVHVEYTGTYERRLDAHRACREWLEARGLAQGGPMWEVFDGPPDEFGIAKVLVYLPVQQ